MTTLHIEHPITDLATWMSAFDRFADRRRAAGVLGECVRQPVDDAQYVLVDLDFATPEQAQGFERFLRTEVWTRPEASPALAGEPQTRLLTRVL
jgi:hypothetical protein